jgi:hypothetical protein
MTQALRPNLFIMGAMKSPIDGLQRRQINRLTRLLGRDFPELRPQERNPANAQAVSPETG